MRRFIFVITLFMSIAAACAPQASATERPSIIIRRPTATPIVESSTPQLSTPGNSPTRQSPAGSVEQAVIEQLAANLGLEESVISVASSAVVEFRDSCLGVEMPDIVCAQVITPGHIIVLEANGVEYVYHATENGSRIQPATLALIWKRTGGIAGFCDTLTVFLSGEVFAATCRPQSQGRAGAFADLLSDEEQAQFNDWIAEFARADLDSSDPKGVSDRMLVTLEVFGNGSEPPTGPEQQMLFEFAQDLYQELAK